MRATYGLPLFQMTPNDDLRLQNRMRHFLSTDPGGSWVADDAGGIVGLSQSFVRELAIGFFPSWPPCRAHNDGAWDANGSSSP